MKKRILVLILLILAVLLYACSKQDFSIVSSAYTYSDAKRYTAGGGKVTGDVEKIDISWIDGKVEIAYHDGDDIVISENEDNLETDKQLHWLVDGDTLYVKYAASGFKTMKNLNKALSVKLPKGIKLDDVVMNTVSSNVQMRELAVKKINIETVSGDVEGMLTQADDVRIHTVSGSVSMTAKQVEAVTVSTVSGKAAFRFETAAKKMNFDSVSGDVTIYLPEDAGFYAKMDSVSGDVGGNLPMERKNEETYTSGDESCRININTVSGDAKLQKIEK